MNNKYRVDWQAGMRLTDETFRSADEYYLSCLQPLYSVLVNGDYGFLSLPIFRYELSGSTLSVTELDANAICYSGKLIQLSFTRENRAIFQNVILPDTREPIILYIDKTSDNTVKIADNMTSVPLCDADYQILVKLEREHYNNPDAVPFARLIYKSGWCNDTAFIAPCISLKANGALRRAASDFLIGMEKLTTELKGALATAQYTMVMSLLPLLSRVSLEVQKEADQMTPRHLITLMQEVIQMVMILAEVDVNVILPEKERCQSFVASHYTPYTISQMLEDGLHLIHVIVGVVDSFRGREFKMPVQEVARPARRVCSTDSIRKKHH